MKKIFWFFTLFVSLLVILTGCSSSSENVKSHPLTANEQFDKVGQVVGDNFKDVKEMFGEHTGYELTGATLNAKPEEANEYTFRLKLESVSPVNQESFDNIKLKLKPYTDKILNKMKEVGIKHPILDLKILDLNAVPFEGSERLTTSFSITI